jgi:hypothetical protein
MFPTGGGSPVTPALTRAAAPGATETGTILDPSDAAGLNVAEYVTVAAQEYDAVTGWIGLVPFEFIVRNFNLRSGLDVRPAARLVGPVVGDDRVGFAFPDMDFISPIGVGFTAT